MRISSVRGGVVGLALGSVLGAGVATSPDVPREIPDYDRASFGAGWLDVDRDCQDTRAEVLIRDARGPVTFRTARGCVVDAGDWVDVYTGGALTVARTIDIDHRVPLRAAWDAGAWAWTDARRRAYANDLEVAEHLVITHRSVNRSKGARTPSAWWPPAARVSGSPAACRYADRWIAVLVEWKLWSSPADLEAFRAIWPGCVA